MYIEAGRVQFVICLVNIPSWSDSRIHEVPSECYMMRNPSAKTTWWSEPYATLEEAEAEVRKHGVAVKHCQRCM